MGMEPGKKAFAWIVSPQKIRVVRRGLPVQSRLKRLNGCQKLDYTPPKKIPSFTRQTRLKTVKVNPLIFRQIIFHFIGGFNRNLVFILLMVNLPIPARAIKPISQYQDLVAGQGSKGFRDGPFYSALFNNPQGLATDPAGKNLYVADRDNNRIRVIRLENSNLVETLAGTGTPGSSDGWLSESSFCRPTLLVYLPENRLVVYDQGNRTFRLLDLDRKRVTTLAGDGKAGCMDGQALKANLDGVWNALYFRQDNSIYFTQPNCGALRKLDLSNLIVSTVLQNDPRIRKPSALCLYKNGIGLSDEETGCIYSLTANGSGPKNMQIEQKIGKGHHVLALTVSDNWLYALQADKMMPWVRIVSNGEPVPLGLHSVWGGNANPKVGPLLNLSMDENGDFIADPRSPRHFFVASRYLAGVLSLKDYSFDQLINGGSVNHEEMFEFEYPIPKAPRTYRILIVGDSYPFYQTTADERRWGWKDASGNGNRMESMPKRLELFLNAQASLEDVPLHFEVLNGSVGGQAACISLCYRTLELVKKYDVDLVLYIVTSSISDMSHSCNLYFSRPLTKEGIPQANQDYEYLLGSWREKIREETPRKFYEYCLRKHRAHIIARSQIVTDFFADTFREPEGRRQIRDMMGKPIRVFKMEFDKLNKASEKKVLFQMCFIPIRDAGAMGMRKDDMECYRDFWKAIADPNEIPFLDLSPAFATLSDSFWPIDETDNGQHFNANGQFLFAYILEHELVTRELIPFTPEKGSHRTFPPTHGTIPPGKKIEERN